MNTSRVSVRLGYGVVVRVADEDTARRLPRDVLRFADKFVVGCTVVKDRYKPTPRPDDRDDSPVEVT